MDSLEEAICRKKTTIPINRGWKSTNIKYKFVEEVRSNSEKVRVKDKTLRVFAIILIHFSLLLLNSMINSNF